MLLDKSAHALTVRDILDVYEFASKTRERSGFALHLQKEHFLCGFCSTVSIYPRSGDARCLFSRKEWKDYNHCKNFTEEQKCIYILTDMGIIGPKSKSGDMDTAQRHEWDLSSLQHITSCKTLSAVSLEDMTETLALYNTSKVAERFDLMLSKKFKSLLVPESKMLVCWLPHSTGAA